MKRWKPKLGNFYFMVTLNCVDMIDKAGWYNSIFDKHTYEIGNCFRTRREAEAMATKIRKLLREG